MKLQLLSPTLILLYGFPGAGKTCFARQLCDEIQAAHLQGDRIRYELFEEAKYDRQEDAVINHLVTYMAEEFLRAGVSVVFDVNAARPGQRQKLRDLARRCKAQTILIWLQTDLESSFTRIANRDRRRADDRYSADLDRTTFETITEKMRNPSPNEEYVVISGKHTFATQRSAVLKKLHDQKLIDADSVGPRVVKPGMVNLIPNPRAGRVDPARRNITIR